MRSASTSPIIQVAIRGLMPVIQLVGLYVFFHGHYSPGGGFQGGVLLAVSVLLGRLALGMEMSQLVFRTGIAVGLSAVGVLVYAGTGLTALLAGGEFLNYGYLPFPGFDPPGLRNLGILMIEGGVTLGVMMSLIAIYDEIVESHG
ncbi:MAG: MnhB domain-containing protein [Desulfobacterales bacterium]